MTRCSAPVRRMCWTRGAASGRSSIKDVCSDEASDRARYAGDGIVTCSRAMGSIFAMKRRTREFLDGLTAIR